MLEKFDIVRFYSSVAIDFLTEFDFELYQSISNYKTDKSTFNGETTAPIIKECSKYLFGELERYFSQNRLTIKKIILKKESNKNCWRPFISVPYEKKPSTNKRVVISSNEIYSYKKGEWICEAMPEITTTGSVLLGYLFKRMEVKMRQICLFKYKSSVEVSSIMKKITDKPIKVLIQNPIFDQMVDDTVVKYFEENHPGIFSNPNFRKTC